jgi:hypothetical protein
MLALNNDITINNKIQKKIWVISFLLSNKTQN